MSLYVPLRGLLLNIASVYTGYARNASGMINYEG